jgi:hypothetical protein
MVVETCCGEIMKRRRAFGIILERYDVSVNLGYGD